MTPLLSNALQWCHLVKHLISIPLKEGLYQTLPCSFKSLGAHGMGSKINIKHEHLVYSIMGRPRIFYGNIKIFQYIVIIILFFLFYIVYGI